MALPKDLISYWKRHKITPPVEEVVCAANKFEDGTIVCGARHFDGVMGGVIKEFPEKKGRHEQGFINQFGVFLSREEAYIIVQENGQPYKGDKCNGSSKVLYNEGLY